MASIPQHGAPYHLPLIACAREDVSVMSRLLTAILAEAIGDAPFAGYHGCVGDDMDYRLFNFAGMNRGLPPEINVALYASPLTLDDGDKPRPHKHNLLMKAGRHSIGDSIGVLIQPRGVDALQHSANGLRLILRICAGVAHLLSFI